MDTALNPFQPAVARWFDRRFGRPTEPQRGAWPSIREGRHTLIAAPTGSGKTLAAFLAAIDDLTARATLAPLDDAVHVVYVSPLKALSNDIQRNLEQPLAEIGREAEELGLARPGIRTLVRTGDTPASERTAMIRRPPHILVTTPESLYILLTSESGRRMLRSARTAIVDEIHAVADDKRGSHLALSLERLDALVEADGGSLVRIGLSATQRPIETVARFLVGARDAPCEIVDSGHRRQLDLGIELPGSPIEAVMSAEVWEEVHDRLAELVREHRTTLIFVNTRRLAERLTRQLADRIGEDQVTSHHGSLAREQRFDAEQRLKSGHLRALVATASLELGIDVGDVDLVCNIGSTRSIVTLLQRVGRSGHNLRSIPRGRIFPTTRDELVESAALLDAIRRGELEQLVIPEQPLDILAQQIVAAVAAEPWVETDLLERFRRAWPYRDLDRATFDAVIRMLSEGFATRRGRRGALLHRDAVHGRLRGRRSARLVAMTSGGAIPDNADFRVVIEPSGTFIGTLDEDFAIESTPGDIFQLGNSSWRVRKIEQGRVLVEDARGAPPTIPFWLGEAPSRTEELSLAVARLRDEVADRLARGRDAASRWLAEEVGTGAVAASQIVDYLETAALALGTLPGRRTLVLERFFDEAGDQHIVLHSPHGARLNRAWGLALRKRFCRSFNFELQAAATEDAIVLSLGPTHSFPANQTFSFLHSNTVRGVLVQALLDAPMFPTRWRWNASRSLALPRFRGGRRVPPPLLRMQAEDLLSVVFPDQLACLENIVGEREIPDHPLVAQTVRDCLEEAMDIDALEALLRRIEQGELAFEVRELREPSPLAHEILGARPYAFLDDAPLEERRTRAVQARRWIDPAEAADLGRLDETAIRRVRDEAWPDAENEDELHDALLTLGYLHPHEATANPAWPGLLDRLVADRRATRSIRSVGGPVWVAAERLTRFRCLFPDATLDPPIEAPVDGIEWTDETALVEILRGRLEGLGPVDEQTLARSLGLPGPRIATALAALEGEGFVMQGRFTADPSGVEWCDRRLLARIHRYTLNRLRSEIEPVSKSVFIRFLFDWQRLGDPVSGREGLETILDQLEGFEGAAGAWESEILPARVAAYDPTSLDALCMSGRITWGRVRQDPARPASGRRPIRSTPLLLVARDALASWNPPVVAEAAAAESGEVSDAESSDARAVLRVLERRGASFFDEIRGQTGLLRTRLEQALGELVARGRVTADSFIGLRALLTPSDRRPAVGRRRSGARGAQGMESAGRWSLREIDPGGDSGNSGQAVPPTVRVDRIARALLRRYGVVCRKIIERESLVPPWRELLGIYRRLEARGEIRGGRFVDGLSGEQFALPEAIGKLRATRKQEPDGKLVSISAADPLNLVGILTPGDRVSSVTGNRILFRDGEPIATFEKGEVVFRIDLPQVEQWPARNALMRRRVPPQLRSYLGRPA